MSHEEKKKCICAAAYRGNIALMQYHLDKGVDVNFCNLNGEFPLYWALKSHKMAPLELLVKHGADVTKCSKSGLSLLQNALLMDQLQQVEFLLKNGAIATSHPESIKLETSKNTIDFLINRAADFNIPESNFPTVLYFAIIFNEKMALDILNKKDIFLEINARHPQGFTLLHAAADCCSLNIVEKLVKSGAKINVLDSDKVTPLYEAVQQENFEIARFLLDNGASLKPIYGICPFVPLHTAAAIRNYDMVKLFVERGADVNEKNAWGRTPLDYACDSSERYEAEDGSVYISDSEDEDEDEDEVQDKDYALFQDDETKEIILFLRNHGANVNLQDMKGRTALHTACELEDRQFVECFLLNGLKNELMCDQNCTFFHPRCNKAWSVNELLPTSQKLNDKNSLCLLKASTIFEHLKNALEILEGTDVNIQDKKCRTALHFAARKGCSEIVKSLMIYQANVNLIDNKGNSALNLALQYYNKNPQPSNLKAAKYITELIAITESNGDANKEDLKLVKNYLLQDHYKKCKMEIMDMKVKKITEESFISFYDFLEKDTDKLAKITKNESIMLSLKSGNYKKVFPIYGNLLERRVDLAELRKMILEISGLIFNHISKKYSDQPKFVVEDILSYLGNEELLLFSMSVITNRSTFVCSSQQMTDFDISSRRD